MGRLFWKFFLVFLLAQVATTVGVGVTLWLRGPPGPPGGPMADTPGACAMGGPGALHGPDCVLSPWQDWIAAGAPAEPARLALTLGPPPYPPHPHGHPHPERHLLPLLPLGAGLIASLIFGALLARNFSQPIRRLRAAVDAVAGGNLATHPGAEIGRRHDDLADLARDFDRMTDRLRQLVENQRRLLHDVSHELRSPLARQQAALDLARQQPGKTDASLGRIESELQRMDRLVGELLTLSRLDAAVGDTARDSVDVGELVNAVVLDAAFELNNSDRSIVLDCTTETLIDGNYELLRRAVENLVRNAIKHTAAGTVVEVSVGAVGQGLQIEVCDRGPGVAPAELETIFEPFFRGREADAVVGHGLGLAIARRVVDAHGGSIRANNRAGGGLCVRILLPHDAGLRTGPH